MVPQCRAITHSDGSVSCPRCRTIWDYSDPDKKSCKTSKEIKQFYVAEMRKILLSNKTVSKK